MTGIGAALGETSAELVKARERIAELEAALRPFSNYNVQGAWIQTAWEDKSETTAVLYCHATKLEITLADFNRATSAMRSKTD